MGVDFDFEYHWNPGPDVPSGTTQNDFTSTTARKKGANFVKSSV